MQELLSSGVRIKQADKWLCCDIYKVSTKGGYSAAYISEDGMEIKRETMARYNWRKSRTETSEALSGESMVQDKSGKWIKAAWFTTSGGAGRTVVYIDPNTGLEIRREPLCRLDAREKHIAKKAIAPKPAYDIISATYESHGKIRRIPHNYLYEIVSGILSGLAELVSEKYDDSKTTTGVFKIGAELQLRLNIIYETVTLTYGELFATAVATARVEIKTRCDSIQEALLAALSKVISGDYRVDVQTNGDITIILRGYDAVESGQSIKWEHAQGSYVPRPLQKHSRETPVIVFRLQEKDISRFRDALPKKSKSQK